MRAKDVMLGQAEAHCAAPSSDLLCVHSTDSLLCNSSKRYLVHASCDRATHKLPFINLSLSKVQQQHRWKKYRQQQQKQGVTSDGASH